MRQPSAAPTLPAARRSRPVLLALLLAACTGPGDPAAQGTGGASGTAIEVTAKRLELGGEGWTADPSVRPRAVLRLDSKHGDFGGFSGLLIDGERWLAVSDRGHWWRGRLRLADDGTLEGVDDNRMGPLHDPGAVPVEGRERRDAEELTSWSGGLVVSFEGEHRLQLYRAGNGHPFDAVADRRPSPVERPPEAADCHHNRCLEAMAPLADGRLLVFSEGLWRDDGDLAAWLRDPAAGTWGRLGLAATESFQPTGAALLPDGDVLLLERAFSPLSGVRARLSRVPAAAIEPGGRLEPRQLLRLRAPAPVDNLEAVAVVPRDGGGAIVYLLSDDNFNAAQRTLVLQLELTR